MPDMEKIIKDNAIRGLQNVIEISGALVHLRKEYAKVILELLKEQEPKPVGKEWNECPSCGKILDRIHDMHYCGVCGQAVKWE